MPTCCSGVMIECYLYPKIIRTHATSGLEPHLSLKHASPGHTHTHTPRLDVTEGFHFLNICTSQKEKGFSKV